MRMLTVLVFVFMMALFPCLASGRTAVLQPTGTALVPSQEGTMIAMRFDLSSIPAGVVVRAALLDWGFSGLTAVDKVEFTAQEITDTWTETGLTGAEDLDYAEEIADDWLLTEWGFDRLGGFMRLEITDLAAKWVASPSVNYGLLITTGEVSSTTVASQLSKARLTVRYTVAGD